jgi:DNA polymerase-3 subunit epsilon
VFRGDGVTLDEYATVVDPVVVSTSTTRLIHGLTDEDVAGAPPIHSVLPDLWRLTMGTVLVSHNLEFERRFVTLEAHRSRLPVPAMLAVCTLRTARIQLDGPSYKLTSLYKTATGSWPAEGHTALGDARATAVVMTWLLNAERYPLYLQAWPPPVADSRYVHVQPGAIAPRAAPTQSNQLGDFVRRFPRSRVARPIHPGARERYIQTLTDVLADERITLEEARLLETAARVGGLSQNDLMELHRQAFFRVFGEEVNIPPAKLTPIRRRELLSLARALDVGEIVDLLAPLVEADQLPTTPPSTGYLKGWRIALDPSDHADLERLRQLAARHDAAIAKNLTKTVRFLAAATPDCPARAKAVALGIRIVSPTEAELILDQAIREADLRAFERRQEHAKWEAQRAADDRYWRHTWRRFEDFSAAELRSEPLG